jgi:Na+/H+-dicarboxylate symporter
MGKGVASSIGSCCEKLGDIGRILLAAILAFAVGLSVREANKDGGDISQFMLWLKFLGQLWLNGLKLVVLPMIFCNMVTSVAALRTLPGARRMAGMTFAYYLCTTLFAALTGFIFTSIIIVPNVVQIPETAIDSSTASAGLAKAASLPALTITQSVQGTIFGIIPSNIIAAAASNNLLGVIFFGLALGFTMDDPENSYIMKFCQEMNNCLTKMIKFLVWFTPVGIFSLVSPKVIELDLSVTAAYIGIFLACVLTALAFHVFVTYPAIFFTLTRKNPFPVMRKVIPAVMTAMGTSSSAATLPVTLDCAKNNGVREDIRKFVCSLGATINMDGTAIGFPCAAIFMAYAQGIELDVGQMIVIVFLATIMSMGAAPIPSSGLVLLVSIMESTQIPVTGLFGLILAVDWIYDRPETMTNIIGDSLAAVIIEHYTAKAELEHAESKRNLATGGSSAQEGVLEEASILMNAKELQTA